MKSRIIFLVVAFVACFVNAAYSNEVSEEYFIVQEINEINDSYRYFTVGVGPIIVIPNVGLGYRERYGRSGWDCGLSFSTVGYAHQLSGHLVGHYYLNNKQNSAYLGLGLTGSGVFDNHKKGLGTLSPDFVYGKELSSDCRRHFIEMHVAIPTLVMHSRHHRYDGFYLPLMYIKYGLSF